MNASEEIWKRIPRQESLIKIEVEGKRLRKTGLKHSIALGDTGDNRRVDKFKVAEISDAKLEKPKWENEAMREGKSWGLGEAVMSYYIIESYGT